MQTHVLIAFAEFLGAFRDKFKVKEANFDDFKFTGKKEKNIKENKQTKQSG